MLSVLLSMLLLPLRPVPDVSGVWEYQSIQRPDGPEVPIAGPFVFCDGYTLQNSLNVGEPFDRQLAQAHFGTYRVTGEQLTLVSTIGLVVDPTRDPPLDSRRGREHRVTAERSGDRLILTFGTGTVQKLRRVGPCAARQLLLLEEGGLALVGGNFVLVAEWGELAVGGSGTYVRSGENLELNAARWVAVQSGRPAYLPPGVIHATFDGGLLRLPGYAPLRVKKREGKQ